MDGAGGDRDVMGSSAGAAERLREDYALDLGNRLAEAVDEAREISLNVAAYEMGRLIEQGLDPAHAGILLTSGATRCGLVKDIGADAVQHAISEGIIAGRQAAVEEISETGASGGPAAGRDAPAAGALALNLIEGEDDEPIQPRGWLLGTTFARGYVSATIAPGATGKTALRTVQLMALAVGRPLTGEYVHQRVPVLQVSMEDSDVEQKRRLRACRKHYGIEAAELNGWFYRLALATTGTMLVVRDESGALVPSPLAQAIRNIVVEKGIGVVNFDPFVKVAGVDENDNRAVDQVMQVLVRIAVELDIAVDIVHHTRKGPAEAGDADAGRGASSMRDAARLAKTLMPMTKEEAQTFGIAEAERRRYVRYDDAKVNLAPAGDTQWFELVGVPLGNATETYPSGDNVQTVRPWTPVGPWDGISNAIANDMLTAIEAGPGDGERYTDHGNGERAAWHVVIRMAPDKTDAQARNIVQTWVRNGVLERRDYLSPSSRRQAKGLFLNHSKRPE